MTLDMVIDLTQRALIEKFEYIKLSRSNILISVHNKWKPYIKSIPGVLTLVNGWEVFQFLSEIDIKVIEEHF